MTIKKQFYLLGYLIIAIPVMCTLIMGIGNYIHSPARMFFHNQPRFDYEIEGLDPVEKKAIFEEIKFYPPEAESIVISTEGKIVYSTALSIPTGTILEKKRLMEKVENSAEGNFFQFSRHKFGENQYTLITKVPRSVSERMKNDNFYVIVVSVMAVLVSFCIFLIVKMSRNIYQTFFDLTEKVSQMADGKFDIQIKSGQKIRTKEILSIYESLEKLRTSLSDAQNRKNKLIMGISHDLRTPVAVIKGYTEALSDGIITEKEEISKTLELIKAKTDHLENMINTLISFVKLESREIRQTLKPHSVTQAITTFAKDAKSTVSVFKRRILYAVDLPEERFVPMDPQLVNRVFENLLSNAIRYTKENDIITVAAYEEGKNIIFKLADTGMGMEQEDLNNIFDLFYRATSSRREEGMGIGLSVVKNIIETHGWKISVDSQKDKGSCFTITIPFEFSLSEQKD